MTTLPRPFLANYRGANGRAAFVRELVEMVLFTNPGERVNQPEFGAGLLLHVFEPNSLESASAIQVRASAALHRWLGELIEPGDVRAWSDEASLVVEVTYLVRGDRSLRTETFRRPAT